MRRVYGVYAFLRWRLLRSVTVGVRILLVRDGAVLLIRHSYQPGWNVPGGGVKAGETLIDAVKREAAEEAGALVRDRPWLLGLYDNFGEGKSDHIALFVSEQWDWQPPSDRWEIEARVLFALDGLPPDLTPRLRRSLADYAARRAAPPAARTVVERW
jgi:8-oxo-dGTP pyrophosphatase MutT (NUDIX family)